MVVCTPYVDACVKSAVEFVLVICDIGGKVGGVSVLTYKHVVLQLQLVDISLGFSFGKKLVSYNFGVFVPDSAFLFVGKTLFGEEVDNLFDLAAFVEFTLEEPLVVLNAVLLHICLHLCNVLGQSKVNKSLLTGGGIHIQETVAVCVVVFIGKVSDVAALIAVLGEGSFGLINLKVSCLQRVCEFLNLITCIVYIELSVNVIACGIKN